MDDKLKYRLINESSYPYTLALILENEDAEAAKKVGKSALQAIQVRLQKLNTIVNTLPNGGYKSGLSQIIEKGLGSDLKDLFDKLESGADPDEDLVAAAEGIGVIADKAAEASRNISKVVAVNKALMETLSKIVVSAGLEKGENKDVPLIQILDESNLTKKTKDELKKAFTKAVQSIKKPREGLFGGFASLADKFINLVDPLGALKDNVDSLIDGILDLTPVQIGEFALAIVNYGKQDEAAAEKTEQTAEDAAEKITDEAGVEQGSNEDDKAEKRPDFDLEAFLKDKYPELAQALLDQVKNNPETAEQLEDLDAQIEDGKISPEDVAEDLEGAVDGTTIKADDILSKAEQNPLLGKGGALVIQRMIDAGLFDDFGIKVEHALNTQNLSLLLEKQMNPEDLEALLDLVKEEQPELFDEEGETKDILKNINKFFKDENIDIQLGDEVEEETGEDADLTPDEIDTADDLADDAERALGNIPFGKRELAKLLKAFPDLSGAGNKATTQRRAFRKAVNQAADETIFEEGVDKKAKQHASRLRILAGIK